MANEIRTKTDTKASFTITLASLANGSVNQSDMISNSNSRGAALVYIKIRTSGSAPTAGSTYKVYLLRGNDPASSNYRTDGAAASAGAMSGIVNANLLGVIAVTASTNTDFYGDFDTAALGPLGPEWGIAVLNNTGQAANSTAGNFYAGYVYYLPEIQ